MRRVVLSMLLLAALAGESAAEKRGRDAPVNGLQMYYEIHGAASAGRPPLVLLHGGGSTIETSFGAVLPSLARTRQSIGAPTLVMIGDADIVRPEHALEMFRLPPHGQLSILPGTDHMTIVKRADWRVSMIEAFLDAPMPGDR